MDELNTATPQPATPQAAAPAPAPTAQAAPAAQGVKYASFGIRFVAALIDGILIAIISTLIKTLLGGENAPGFLDSVMGLASIVYYVFMISKYGATVGKKLMKIRVQNIDTGANLTFVEAILREFIGKLLSSIIFLLGYFWMLWDPKKQTWHDKIAKSIVVQQ